ncbi:hypothetical protein M5K25_000224 [Dendrobium thyrsiflorum]|uniref:Kri1-like C-terminal domain-containing protein n=1 Tax=Dendrobium thyrsiflorum TaxID=117978 RepID=A0ABD0W5Z7_DENTH
MKEMISADYYNTEDVDPGFGSDVGDDLEKPDFEKEDKLLGKRKRKQNISLREKVELDKELDEYYKLDYKGNIGDLKTRFKYRFIPADSYGLQTEEILIANAKDLNQGNVALSVLMTTSSTFTAAIMKPFLTSKLAGQFIGVDPAGLFISIVQVVLFPVLLGTILNQYYNNLVKFVSPVMPFIAVATVAILCDSAIAQSASAILSSGLQVVIASITLHGSGFFFSYLLSKLLGIGYISERTISIEVDMQNFVLGVVLASRIKASLILTTMK